MRRQSCQQDGAEQQRKRAAPPGHVCASAHGGVSGAQSRFAGADCPAGQLCRPADRRARCPADRRAPCRADFRVESVHVSPPFRCGSVCAAALFHAGGGIALRGRAFCIPGLNPGGTGEGGEPCARRGLARLGSDYPLGVISRDPAYPAAYCPQRSRTRWSDHGSTRALRHRPACRPAGSGCRTSPARCRRFSAEAQDPSQSP